MSCSVPKPSISAPDALLCVNPCAAQLVRCLHQLRHIVRSITATLPYLQASHNAEEKLNAGADVHGESRDAFAVVVLDNQQRASEVRCCLTPTRAAQLCSLASVQVGRRCSVNQIDCVCSSVASSVAAVRGTHLL